MQKNRSKGEIIVKKSKAVLLAAAIPTVALHLKSEKIAFKIRKNQSV